MTQSQQCQAISGWSAGAEFPTGAVVLEPGMISVVPGAIKFTPGQLPQIVPAGVTFPMVGLPVIIQVSLPVGSGLVVPCLELFPPLRPCTVLNPLAAAAGMAF